MTQLEIKVDEQPSKVVGMDGATSMTVKLISGPDYPEPWLFAEAYKREGDRIAERREWKFIGLTNNSKLGISFTVGKEVTAPDEVDSKYGPRSQDEMLRMKESIDQVNAFNVLLQSKLDRADKVSITAERPFYCSFCGLHEDKVRHLIAGPAVFICDECIEVCAATLKAQEKT